MCSEKTTNLIIPQKVDCVYTSCYCEENIWHLAQQILETNKSITDLKCYIVFLSNSNKCVHLWKQQSKQNDSGLVFWDYHVFLITQHQDATLVFDLDTTLPFPVSFSQYVKEAVGDEFFDIQSKRYFRIIEAKHFLQSFSSDRGHMLKDGHWMSPPPPYPPILKKDKQHNLDCFISMDSSNEFGQVLSLEEFKTTFS